MNGVLTPTPKAIDVGHAAVAETNERIASWWVKGAELPAAELEEDIDRAVLAGGPSGVLNALAVYEQAAQGSCARAQVAAEGPTSRAAVG